ncbi:methylated-DNA--[protein]-cysteine S-methyltransferase [Leptolyngbya sp. 7M]|nr:methylated-DNA--[protein]-cysteine S-methyltransferase [Leptolyngbya sp. 7M]
MLAIASDRGLCMLEFNDRRAIDRQLATLRRHFTSNIQPGRHPVLDHAAHELARYFEAPSLTFTVPLADPGTPFQRRVWDALRQITHGTTRTYAQLAQALGRPTAARAVARASADNRIAIIIPCHRVIGSDGSPTGYAGGIWRKQWLLTHERDCTDITQVDITLT